MIIKRKQGKINRNYGINDYYKYYTSNYENAVSSQKFNKVISEFNGKIVNAIINDGLDYTPPKLQLSFCIRKYKKVIKIENGKLINTNPIDWKTTNDLWKSDNDAAEKKILIRFLNNHSSKYIFRIKILKVGYNYKNKKYYRFKACRGFQRALSARILDPYKNNFNAYDLY